MAGNRPPLGRGNPDCRAALATLIPELREAFKEASTLLGIAEDDVIHLWMVSQAKLLEAFKGALGKDMLAALQPGADALQRMDKRFEQLVQSAREAAQSRREQQEALRQDEQKARDKHLQATQDGFAALRDELAKARRLYLATAGVAVGLAAALCLGGMAWWHSSAEKDEQAQRDTAAQAYEQSDEGTWWHNLRATRAGLHFTLGDEDSNGISRRLSLMVSPGKDPGSWKLTSANLDAGGNAVLTFRKPEPGAGEATAAAGRHR